MSTAVETPPAPSLAPPQDSPSPWIYRPWLDLLVGCGAWSAPLLLLGFYSAQSYSRAWVFAFYFLALFFNYPHFMATVYRAYHTHSEFAKYRIFTVHVAVLLALAGVLAHLWYALVPWIFTLYICWSPWHYTGQNFGLLMMFARRAGISPTPAERRALHLAFLASYLLLMLSFHTGASGDPLVISLGLPEKFTLPARGVLALFFVVSSGWALVSLARRSSLRAIIAPFALATTQFLWFLLPAAIQLASGREIAQTRYSSGILAVLHSTQYLWITSYYQKREARAAGDTRWKFSRYLVTLIAGGIALFIPGPWIVSRVFHADFAASFLTFTALVNIHHFILDGALWKLRDSRISALLLDTRTKMPATGAGAQNNFVTAARWLAGRSSAARAVRITMVAMLFTWGAVDQLHFFWAGQETSLASLQRAARLNPNDSAVQTRLAKAQALSGQRDSAITSLERAASLNPADLSLQEAYGRGLIEAGRDSEAYSLYQKMLRRFPRDANALVNYGLLAHRLGHEDEALDSWRRAVEIDPQQYNAQLYIAQFLDQTGEAQAAASHYRAYLKIVAANPDAHRSESATVLAVLIKVADADAAVNHAAEATQGYRAAVQFGEKSGDKTLESLALAHLAELQEKQGDIATAAQSYQRGLTLDASLSDPRSAASDWVNYGQFLRRQGKPERFVYACFLRAEELLRSTPGTELSVVTNARAETEARLGREAAAVRNNRDTILGEALHMEAASFRSKG
jgi:tetratricopeptide (TPR) repeat protein